MLTSRKVYLACLSLGQEEEVGGLVGIGFFIRINPSHTNFMSLLLPLELADYVWSTKRLAHENKSFSSPPLNVWFRGAVQQITLSFQNSLLAAHKGVHKGTLIDDSVRPEENDIRRGLHFSFFSNMAREFSLRSSPLGGRFCLRDTTTKEF